MRSYLKRTPEGKYEWNHQSQTVKRLAKKIHVHPEAIDDWRAFLGGQWYF